MITHEEAYQDFITNNLKPYTHKGEPITFPKLMQLQCLASEEKARKDLVNFLEEMDKEFRYSKDRTKDYYVKDTRKRSLTTMLGDIEYTRTIYVDRLTHKTFTYVDEKMGIDKYYRYTNDVACAVVDRYSNENSMIKVGEEIGGLIHTKFSLEDNRHYAIPRQTIQRMFKRVKETRIIPKDNKKEIDILYLLVDEKYLADHTRLNTNTGELVKHHKMTKVAMICEGLDASNKTRHKYINCRYFSLYESDNKDFNLALIEFLDQQYDLEKLKKIYVLGDGALWIKNLANELKFPGVTIEQDLCKFHFHQALYRIFKDSDKYQTATKSLYANNKKELYELFDSLDKDSDLIKQNISYIKKNYKLIRNMIDLKDMNCAMEQCISHHIVSQFANVAKVYGDNTLNIYLSYRDNYRNGENVKLIYLEALKDTNADSNKTIINKQPLNLSHFDQQVSDPYYTTELTNGKKPVKFTPKN